MSETIAPTRPLSETKKKILAYYAEHDTPSYREVSEAFGISEIAVLKHVRTLVELGLVVKNGHHRAFRVVAGKTDRNTVAVDLVRDFCKYFGDENPALFNRAMVLLGEPDRAEAA